MAFFVGHSNSSARLSARRVERAFLPRRIKHALGEVAKRSNPRPDIHVQHRRIAVAVFVGQPPVRG
jgi:hypothetical protein